MPKNIVTSENNQTDEKPKVKRGRRTKKEIEEAKLAQEKAEKERRKEEQIGACSTRNRQSVHDSATWRVQRVREARVLLACHATSAAAFCSAPQHVLLEGER